MSRRGLADTCDMLETTAAESDATKRWLTSRANVKTALLIVDTASDTLIDTLIARVSALIAAECALARDKVQSVASFAQETLKASFLEGWHYRGETLTLPWRVPVSEIVSVVEGGDTLTADSDYRLLSGKPGRLRRLDGGLPACWSTAAIAVTFKAGFALPASVPLDIEAACIEQVKAMLLGADRDPMLRTESTPDVGTASYNTPGGDAVKGVLLPQVIDALAPYKDPLP